MRNNNDNSSKKQIIENGIAQKVDGEYVFSAREIGKKIRFKRK